MIAPAGSSDKFKTHLDAVGLVDPESDLPRCARADQYERAGRVTEARREFSAVNSRSDFYASALTRIAFIDYRSGDYAGAVAGLRRAAELRPGDDRLLDLLGAAAVQTGDFQLASSTWEELGARGAADEKTLRAIERLRLWIAIERVSHGHSTNGLGELEDLYRKSGEDESAGRALSDLYFANAVELLEATPPDSHRAKELLLLGKHMSAHPKFEYAMALSDLIQGHNQPAAARLRLVLAANAKNPGASYHLGAALSRSGDSAAAEAALRAWNRRGTQQPWQDSEDEVGAGAYTCARSEMARSAVGSR